VLGQALLTKRMGKPRVIAETGAGQHGVATATAAALFGLECTVYMGEVDTERQALNVARMRLLGESAQAAADAVIAEVGELGGDGGVIVAAPDGTTAFAFNTSGMYRARADSAGLHEVAIFARD